MEHARPIRRRARLATALAAVAGSVALVPARSAFPQESAIEILPLAPGNTWTYDGTVWWVPRNSRRVLEERVRLNMRVEDVVERPGVRAALLYGYPRDLVTRDQDRFEGVFTLLQVGPTVHVLRGAEAREALRRVADPADSLADLLLGSEVVLDLPLAEGKTFCSSRGRGQTSPGPCWLVSGEGKVERIPVAGLDETLGRDRFVLALQSGTDHEVRGFLPGIGFTSFAIGHYGDPSALELELVDTRLAEPPRSARGLFLKTLDLSHEQVIEMASASDRAERAASTGTAEPGPPRGTAPVVAGTGEPATPETVREPVVRGAAVQEPAGEPAPERAASVEPEPLPATPPPAPLSSSVGQLPERRTIRMERPAEPIQVAVEDLPVPVWEDTRPACLDARDWYVGGASIQIEGRDFDPVGSAEPIDPGNLVPVAEYDGVPAFAGRLSDRPHMDLWLPLCGTPGTYRLYADLTGR